MPKINYVIREDEMPEMFTGESVSDFIDLDEILDDYPYLIESMEKENYYIENEMCTVFDELLYENKVVGFAAFELEDNVMMLTECYIMPEFRGKRIFFNELCKISSSIPKFGILQPTRNIVELLIDYSFAKNVTGNIVASGIDFYFDEFDAKSNRRDEISYEIPLSNFYDLEICSTILVDDDEVIYHNLLENDLKKYGERTEISEDYFTGITELFCENQNEFKELVEELKDNVPHKTIGYDEIIGKDEGLSEIMQSIVDNEIISYDRAFEIKQQLIEEYDSGEINDENISDRMSKIILDEIPPSMMLDHFDEFIDSSDIDEDDKELLKGFFDIIGDDEELVSDIFESILLDDEEEFDNKISHAMENDEEMFIDFLDLIDDLDDDNEMSLSDDQYLDLNSLGLNPNSPYPVAEMMWGVDDEKYKLDDTFYGKDYPISYDIYIYRVLNSIKNHDIDLPTALALADMKGAMTSHTVISLLHMHDFIDDEVNYDNWDEFAHDSLTVNDLKNILRENNLKISGKKQELIDRIAENQIPLDEFRCEKVKITPEGEEFLHNNKWIAFYDDFLGNFDFNDFLKFLENTEGEFFEVISKYLEEHLKIAEKENNVKYIANCAFVQHIIIEFGDKLSDSDRYV